MAGVKSRRQVERQKNQNDEGRMMNDEQAAAPAAESEKIVEPVAREEHEPVMVAMRLPLVEFDEAALYASPRVDLKLDAVQARTLKMLVVGLQGQEYAPGRTVHDGPSAIRWLLNGLGAAVGENEER